LDRQYKSISGEIKDEKGYVILDYGIYWTSEALNTLINFFFEEVGVSRIESRYDPNNPNSGKVMIKCDMKYEGLKRQADWNNQGICDSVEYAILAEDYFKK